MESSRTPFVSCICRLAADGSGSSATILVKSRLLSRVVVESCSSDKILVRSLEPLSNLARPMKFSLDFIRSRTSPLDLTRPMRFSSVLVRRRQISLVRLDFVRSRASTEQVTSIVPLPSVRQIVSLPLSSFLYRLSIGSRGRLSFVPLSLLFK
ncbi:unnamed protein product, partial [Citrullus colocynthis]